MTRDYHTLPDDHAEMAIFQRAQLLDDNAKLSYSEMGLMAVEVKRRLLWRYRTDPDIGMPCRSFTRWMRIAFQFSYSTAFAAYAEIEPLLEDIPAEEIAQIPPGNLHTLTSLSTAVRSDSNVLKAAIEKRPAQFTAYIQAEHPNQHIASKVLKRFALNPVQNDQVEAALGERMAMGAASPNEALAAICEEWIELHEALYPQPQEGPLETIQ